MSRETSREARYPPSIRRALTKFSRPSQYVRTCACSVSKKHWCVHWKLQGEEPREFLPTGTQGRSNFHC